MADRTLLSQLFLMWSFQGRCLEAQIVRWCWEQGHCCLAFSPRPESALLWMLGTASLKTSNATKPVWGQSFSPELRSGLLREEGVFQAVAGGGSLLWVLSLVEEGALLRVGKRAGRD